MKKETLKEIGKFHLDVSKILMALAVISPVVKEGSVSFGVVIVIAVIFAVGVILINKGASDEWSNYNYGKFSNNNGAYYSWNWLFSEAQYQALE